MTTSFKFKICWYDNYNRNISGLQVLDIEGDNEHDARRSFLAMSHGNGIFVRSMKLIEVKKTKRPRR